MSIDKESPEKNIFQENEKLEKLSKILKEMESVVLSYSGGVDSTFLLYIAKEVLGGNVIAATAISDIYPEAETETAEKISSDLGVKQITIKNEMLENNKFIQNTPERCYYCKKNLYEKLWEIAEEKNIDFIIDGTTSDDKEDYRPGMKAADELDIRSPLAEAGITKSEVREFSKKLGLTTWDKPSTACLATRIPYETKIKRKVLKKIEKLEKFIKSMGIKQIRARHHGNLARIETNPQNFDLLIENRKEIIEKFRKENYDYVTLDLAGYEEGSINKPLENKK